MQTPGSASALAPVLVLAIGNRLLKDDGVGAELLSRLAPEAEKWGPEVELLDGGTRGLALLGEVQDRRAVLILDAAKLGSKPGSVHVLRETELFEMSGRASSAHEGGVLDVLAAMQLLGGMPEKFAVVGVEPAVLDAGLGVSAQVESALDEACEQSIRLIEESLEAVHVSRATGKNS